MVSSNLNNLTKLKQTQYKTFFRNQVETFDYENLFADRRVIVFTITNPIASFSFRHARKFSVMFDQFVDIGINDIYAVNFYENMFGPWTDKHASRIKGLPDRECVLLDLAKAHTETIDHNNELRQRWQWVAVINNGQIEQFWQNPYTAGMSLKEFKNEQYQYRGLDPEIILDNLATNK